MKCSLMSESQRHLNISRWESPVLSGQVVRSACQVSSLTVWQLSDGADIVPAGKPSLVISRQVCNRSPARCCKSQAHRCNQPRFNHAAFVPNVLQDSLYSICKGNFSEVFLCQVEVVF